MREYYSWTAVNRKSAYELLKLLSSFELSRRYIDLCATFTVLPYWASHFFQEISNNGQTNGITDKILLKSYQVWLYDGSWSGFHYSDGLCKRILYWSILRKQNGVVSIMNALACASLWSAFRKYVIYELKILFMVATWTWRDFEIFMIRSDTRNKSFIRSFWRKN